MCRRWEARKIDIYADHSVAQRDDESMNDAHKMKRFLVEGAINSSVSSVTFCISRSLASAGLSTDAVGRDV